MDIVAQMLESAVDIRGRIITATIVLETAINIFLSNHFCSDDDKRNEITEFIFATNKFMYESKRDTICAILKKHKSYKISKDDVEQLYDDLKKISIKRNLFAHSELDIDEKSIKVFKKNETIIFNKFINSKKPHPFTPDDINDFVDFIIDKAKFIHKITNAATHSDLSEKK